MSFRRLSSVLLRELAAFRFQTRSAFLEAVRDVILFDGAISIDGANKVAPMPYHHVVRWQRRITSAPVRRAACGRGVRMIMVETHIEFRMTDGLSLV